VRVGRLILGRVAGADSPFELLAVEDFVSGHFDLLGFQSTRARMALVFAPMRQVEGRLAESRAFADYGLAHVGGATGLRAQLERLGSTMTRLASRSALMPNSTPEERWRHATTFGAWCISFWQGSWSAC
jgi:hypothetical protein